MGFSMGAYGALRTYIEEPGRYRAIAVFCTPPAFPVGGETHPDFTEPKCVKALTGTPVFVFHGRRDNSAPFANAERMVAALRQAGARVTFIIEDDAGHDIPSAQTLRAYSDWANSILDR
jgi:predicted esterase